MTVKNKKYKSPASGSNHRRVAKNGVVRFSILPKCVLKESICPHHTSASTYVFGERSTAFYSFSFSSGANVSRNKHVRAGTAARLQRGSGSSSGTGHDVLDESSGELHSDVSVPASACDMLAISNGDIAQIVTGNNLVRSTTGPTRLLPAAPAGPAGSAAAGSKTDEASIDPWISMGDFLYDMETGLFHPSTHPAPVYASHYAEFAQSDCGLGMRADSTDYIFD